MEIYIVEGVTFYGKDYNVIFNNRKEATECAVWHRERGDSAFVTRYAACEYVAN